MVDKGQGRKTFFLYITAYATGILTLFPFLWMVSTSFKSQKEAFTSGLSIIPQAFRLENYADAFEKAMLWRYLFNSLFVSVLSTAGVAVTSLLAGYALSRMHFPGRKTIFLIVLGTMLIPHQATMVPSFLLMKTFGWVNSYQALIVPFLVYPFAVFLIRNFLFSIPKDLEEAANLDGCSRIQTLLKVILPISKPAIASVVIFNFTYVWNDFFWPLVMTTSTEMRTIQVGLALIKSEFLMQWPMLMAATVLSSIPIFVVYTVFQKFFVQGSVSSGVKG
ncbi:carbohydrate ABC transporter permease [Paenibacillus thalictri]|uniref:Carbohydrate ABC transporter permease n=1 Tax=Paenibacillus thalictri TaxID=2527873 RepID=A0A4Q9DTY8_9BACL|nr:carbohydrate ABC transporter permease [Paenibacillus thalictri]TBL79013.1 carbohydrate ABC transporter permease [Paenibacillus thalictri]